MVVQSCVGVHQGPGRGRCQPWSGEAPVSVHFPPKRAERSGGLRPDAGDSLQAEGREEKV